MIEAEEDAAGFEDGQNDHHPRSAAPELKRDREYVLP